MKIKITLWVGILFSASVSASPVFIECQFEFLEDHSYICETNKNLCRRIFSINSTDQSVEEISTHPNTAPIKQKILKWTNSHVQFTREASRRISEDGKLIFIAEKPTNLNRINGAVDDRYIYKLPTGEVLSNKAVREMEASLGNGLLDGMPIMERTGTCQVSRVLF